MNFAEKVRYLRAEKGLTQAQLGKLAFINQRTVDAYEHGRARPREGTARQLAKALGVKYELLINDDKPCVKEGKNGKINNQARP